LVEENGRYVIRIPESGVLGIKGCDPFQSYLVTASFANGDNIWVSKRIDDKPRKEQTALWGAVTLVRYENKKPISAYWWFVGTEAEWNDADNEVLSRPGKVFQKPDNDN
jgi:hypothetical protein